MLLVQYGYIFLVLIFLLLFSSPEGSENKEKKNIRTRKIYLILYSVPCDNYYVYFKKVLLEYFDVDVETDTPDVYPTCVCERCRKFYQKWRNFLKRTLSLKEHFIDLN